MINNIYSNSDRCLYQTKTLFSIIVLFLSLILAPNSVVAITEEQLKILDMLEQLDQLDKLDQEEFNNLINQADKCTRDRNFDCTERALTSAQKVITTSNDKKTLNAAYVALDAERKALALEIEARQRALVAQQEAQRAAEQRNSNRNVFAAIAGVAMGVGMTNMGASSSASLEAATAMFKDVSGNTTSNMQALNNQYQSNSNQPGRSLNQNQTGFNQPSGSNDYDPNGCIMEAAKCGSDSACRDRVYQSSICNNGSSSYTYDDMLNNNKMRDSRIKANPNIGK